VKRERPPSRDAFTLSIDPMKGEEECLEEIGTMVDAILEAEPEPFPQIGACLCCPCDDYRPAEPTRTTS
jgi:hypothetical protein